MHRMVLLLAVAGGLIGHSYETSTERSERAENFVKEARMTEQNPADRIRGKKIRWTWTEGPVAGTTHEHIFHEDGSVTWEVVDGPQEGHSATEAEYAAVKVADDVYAVSYLAASGYTLTVVLNFRDRSMVGFASGADEWHPGRGTFEVVE